MNEPANSIFRTSALRRHAEEREQVVLPRLVSPRVFLVLWLLLGLLVGAGIIVWLALLGG
jgi:hypothetical protein